MSLKRLVLGITFVLLCLGWSVTAQSAQYKLSGDGSGGQVQVGGGLPLPIQIQQFTTGGSPTNVGTNFPPLKIPKRLGPVTITGTTAMSAQQQLNIPANALSKIPAQLTLGQFGQNPSLYAVGTNLGWQWPAAPAVLNTTARTGAKTTTVTGLIAGGSIRYSNALANKFGGPASFLITGQPGQGVMPAVAVTIWAIAVPGPGNPPCTHTALGGPNPACVAAIGQALPTGLAAVGGPALNTVTTAGGTPLALVKTGTGTTANGPGPQPGILVIKATSNGKPTIFAFASPTKRGITNAASSTGFPWTTGMLTIKAPAALGAPETFTITGMDNRGANGAGTIQLVAGAVSTRTKSGPNANRGWVRLKLVSLPVSTPAVPPSALVAGAGLMLLAAGYALRRFKA